MVPEYYITKDTVGGRCDIIYATNYGTRKWFIKYFEGGSRDTVQATGNCTT